MHPYCGDCPRGKEVLPGYLGAVPSYGSADSPVMVVGMSPGKDEIALGEPFVAGSGALLKTHGNAAGLFREDCYLTQVVQCHALGAKHKTLKPAQLSACRPRFEQEVAAFRGEVILCLGAEAFDAVTGLITWEKEQNKRAVRGFKRKDGGNEKAKPVGIGQWRGYLVEPKDCVGITRSITRKSHENFYQTAGVCPQCKGIDVFTLEETQGTSMCSYCNNTGRRKKDDPKLETVEIEVPRPFSPSVRWIVGTYSSRFIADTGQKLLPAFVNDVARVVRAWKRDLDLVEISYQERLP